ncbi:MAG: DUF2279 domain-containing protein [bacterium]|nr:DUF2279 domain-containing protein [Candidatus Kapabacteria bacterium]
MLRESGVALCCTAVLLLAITIVRVDAASIVIVGGDATPQVDTTTARDSTSIQPDNLRLALIGGVTVGGFIYGHVLQSDIWWKGDRSDFHFEWKHDWTYALGADKLGHMWFPYATTHTYSHLFRWAGVDSTTAIWSAASLALAYQTYIEVRDGFSAVWGFSWGDCAANVVGAGLPVAQHYLPALRLFDYEISFYPSDRFRAGTHAAIIDDYESAHHWLSLHMANVIPDSWRGYYPEFIDVAIGHGVRELDDKGGGRHEIYLALDWNLDRLPGDWWGWNLLRHVLRHYHLPSPAIRLYPGPVHVGFRF